MAAKRIEYNRAQTAASISPKLSHHFVLPSRRELEPKHPVLVGTLERMRAADFENCKPEQVVRADTPALNFGILSADRVARTKGGCSIERTLLDDCAPAQELFRDS